MANPEHVDLLQQGVAAITAWRSAHPDERLDLEKADLTGIILPDADLQGARLHEARMDGAIGLETCRHLAPSYLDPGTLTQSGSLPITFLQACG